MLQSLSEVFYHNFPSKEGGHTLWQIDNSSATHFALGTFACLCERPLIIITQNAQKMADSARELPFFCKKSLALPILSFPDWETLPYDHFSPHQDLTSQRIGTLYQMPKLKNGIVIVAINTLLQRLPPRSYIEANSLVLNLNQTLSLDEFRSQLTKCGYRAVDKVYEHGEYALRGSIIDIFPMGAKTPYRIDLFDQEIDSIRQFDPETQRSTGKITEINLLPAREFPLTHDAMTLFRKKWREIFPGDPSNCPIFESISNGESAQGIEYYLNLFFETTETLVDYFPANSIIAIEGDIQNSALTFWQEIKERYEELRHDKTRPILSPTMIFSPVDHIFARIKHFPQIFCRPPLDNPPQAIPSQTFDIHFNKVPDITIDNKLANPLAKVENLYKTTLARILICAESVGRRENILELFQTISVQLTPCESWEEFLSSTAKISIIIAPLNSGFILNVNEDSVIVITETELYGQQITLQRRMRKTSHQDPEAIIRDLTELSIGAPVVHIEHGIGRYLGLQTLRAENVETEFLTLEYANNAKLYVPIASLHLISRYTGGNIETVQYSDLGNKQWEKTKHKAAEKIRDVAAELLDLYAKREARPGYKFPFPEKEYQKFASAFPFEETPDQLEAIRQVIEDLTSSKHMDRLICGDVGFGKTEVAMRATFIVAHAGMQVVILCPTTILAQQHYDNFQNRFAEWPFKIDLISRFRTSKEQNTILEHLKTGRIDIIIGTHKLLQSNVHFKNLGLIIIDEEHRFGVKQKERLKEMRPDIDVLTLTATPIPRTLNMAFAGIRDFSIIATPPARRLAIKTFLHERDGNLIREAILREILRGGQVYFLHNYVATIEKVAGELQRLIPTIKVTVAHGQMREHQLERIMRDFYHHRYNVLICTTIIESGIDVPTANTIIIDNADRFGLAQLHQLRGRVGRSHHQAYAYLLTKSPKLLTEDAKKRLEAISSMEDLGVGFTLATHDLEIRGAGELLGEEQSGQIEGIGFSLYMDYLERAIHALKTGQKADLDSPPFNITEIDLHIPALIPPEYLNDVNSRLTFYKRIANAKNNAKLEELREELIDRFGLLPEATKSLFKLTQLRLRAEKLGIRKVTAGKASGIIEFVAKPSVELKKIISLVQSDPTHYKIKGSNKLEFGNLGQLSSTERITALEKLLDKIS